MTVVIANGFAHRLTRSGIMESGIFDGQKIEDWWQRSKEEMGMTGGDEVLVRETLVRLSHIFQEGYRLPSTEAKEQKIAQPSEPV